MVTAASDRPRTTETSTLSGGYERLICVLEDALVQMRPFDL
jgi:hypothetical protein